MRRLETTTLGLLAIHALAAVACGFLLPSKAACIALYGLLNNGILLAYYGSPLSSIKQVLRTKSAESIHRPMVALNGLNALFWSTYALALKDLYILVPNSIGAVLSAVQLGLSVAMPASPAAADDEPVVEEVPAGAVAGAA